jgi:hypothetical protein
VCHCEPGYIGLDTYDVLTQQVVSHHFDFDEGRQARLFRTPHRYIWPAELDLMAQLAGFELESRHADRCRSGSERATGVNRGPPGRRRRARRERLHRRVPARSGRRRRAPAVPALRG